MALFLQKEGLQDKKCPQLFAKNWWAALSRSEVNNLLQLIPGAVSYRRGVMVVRELFCWRYFARATT